MYLERNEVQERKARKEAEGGTPVLDDGDTRVGRKVCRPLDKSLRGGRDTTYAECMNGGHCFQSFRGCHNLIGEESVDVRHLKKLQGK